MPVQVRLGWPADGEVMPDAVPADVAAVAVVFFGQQGVVYGAVHGFFSLTVQPGKRLPTVCR